ncbi:MAG TPA: tRNA-intron lyase [Nitrososphaera sp.]|nr:tRNA-intron lyase [Nitrososphaera sp.]
MSSAPPAEPIPNASTEEGISVVEARLSGGRALVEQVRYQDELRTKGFGEKEDSSYILKPYEILYLLHTKRLLLAGQKDLTFDDLFHLMAKHDSQIMTKFLVYRDLRSKGYVAKEGFGFGNDFRVYERGEYEKKPAKYVVFSINEGANITARSFCKAVEQIEKMGKEAVIAVIERRGEVIYYKASKMGFLENRHRLENKG